jgi:hypothetical protein
MARRNAGPRADTEGLPPEEIGLPLEPEPGVSGPRARTVLAAAAALLGCIAAVGALSADDGWQTSGDLTGRDLVGTSLVTAGQSLPLGPRDGYSVTFDRTAGTLRTTYPCGSFTGQYKIVHGHVEIDPAALPDEDGPVGGGWCWTPAGEVARKAMAALFSARPAIRTEKDGVVLTADAVTLTLADRDDVDPDLPLLGTRWQLTEMALAIAEGRAQRGSSLRGTTGWLVLSRYGVTGKVSCATFHAPADVDGDTVVIGEPRLDRTLCPSPKHDPNFSKVWTYASREVFERLTGTLRADVRGSTLSLYRQPDGAGVELEGFR